MVSDVLLLSNFVKIWLILTGESGRALACLFFLPDLFFIEKKASAAFITNYVTGLNKT